MTVLARESLAGEYVVDALVDALKGIKTEDGYATDVASVRRWSRDEEFSIEGPTIIVHYAARQELDAVGNPEVSYFDARGQVQLMYFVSRHPLSDEPLDTVLSAAAQDLLTALERVDWSGLEAYIDRLETTSFYSTNPAETFDGVEATVNFKYRVDPEKTTRRLPFWK